MYNVRVYQVANTTEYIQRLKLSNKFLASFILSLSHV
jgi:hypothetical protein